MARTLATDLDREGGLTVYARLRHLRAVSKLARRTLSPGHVPGVAVGTALAVGYVLAGLAPLGESFTAFTWTTDALPLVVADGPSTPVVGYLHAGITRVYLPVPSVLAVLVGELVAVRRGTAGYLLAVALGAVGAGSVVVLSGCGCGSGGAAYLFDAALRTV